MLCRLYLYDMNTYSRAKKIGAACAVLSFTLIPVLASAQSSTTSTSTSWRYRGEGLSPWGNQDSQQISDWRRQNNELQQKISALDAVAVTSIPIAVLFGVALRNITSNFGDPRGDGTRSHEGLDIIAVKGTPIVSPTPAVVLSTGNGDSSGLYVYTANPGGETFVYMHLDKIGEQVSPGAVLEAGSLIGYVGNTGNASGGGAHLHFEIKNGAATDPYPRITREFTAAEKMEFLNKIFGQSSDSIALSQFLASNFRSTFTAATAQGVILPPLITGALQTAPVLAPTAGGSVSVPAGDLQLGSKGALVVELQQFLIAKAAGPATVRLKGAGATGNFGPMTQAALIEYQLAAGITPANGYYGPTTRASVSAGTVTTTTPIQSPTSPTGAVVLTRNLSKGMSGEDVRDLQKMLNAKGFTVSLSGAGSAGNESTYFGPATLAAVIKFQLARLIEPAVGFVGPLTRAALVL